MAELVLESQLSCPDCGFRWRATMPTNACVFFAECPNCMTMLRPRPGDCCVFCSYGSVACPPIQRGGDGRPPRDDDLASLGHGANQDGA